MPDRELITRSASRVARSRGWEPNSGWRAARIAGLGSAVALLAIIAAIPLVSAGRIPTCQPETAPDAAEADPRSP